MQQPKPIIVPPLGSAPQSSSRPPPRSSKRPLRRPSKHNPSPKPRPDPSSGLLALLVTVAGSSPVAGRPLESDIPPDFLCPRLHARPASQHPPSQDPSLFSWDPCQSPEPSSSQSASTQSVSDQSALPRRKRAQSSNNIADKFEQFPDGRWRKADSWELYGSKACAISQCMDAAETDLPVQDDVTPPTGVESAAVSSTSITPSLPNGWGKNHGGDNMTGMILGLSLSLACTLVFFMIGIVLWRRRRRKDTDVDAEKTASDRYPDGDESEEVKRARSQQRKWARASAKWMAHVRQSARRRRKRLTMVGAKNSETSLLDDRQVTHASSSAVSLARTATSDHQHVSYSSRAHSRHGGSGTGMRSRSSSVVSCEERPEADDVPHPPSSHPPAYIHSSSSLYHRSRRHSHHETLQRRPSRASNSSEPPPPCSATQTPSRSPTPLPYEPPVDSAHVATDDKAVLAQMARLASAPPQLTGRPLSSDVPEGTLEVQPSVPVLEDDGFEPLPPELQEDVDMDRDRLPLARPSSSSGLTHDTLPSMLHASSPYREGRRHPDLDSEVPSYAEDALRHPPLTLPSPPSKVPLTGPMFYEYPSEFEEDVANTEPALDPSSPPFEAPSAPPFAEYTQDAEVIVVPSAPPLEFVDEFPSVPEELVPSAPPLDPLEDGTHHAASTSEGLPGVEASAPQSSVDDRGSDDASARSDAPHLSSGYGNASPPQYLP